MKILVLTSRYTATRDIIGEDFGRQTRLFSALKKLGHEIHFFCADYKRFQSKETKLHGIKVYIRPFGAHNFLRFIIRLNSKIKKEGYDLIIGTSDPLWGVMGYFIARKNKNRFLYDLHDNYEIYSTYKLPFFRYIDSYIVKKSEIVTTVSSTLLNKISHLRKGKKTQVIENGADLSVFRKLDRQKCRKELKLPERGKIIAYTGSLQRTQGIDILIESFKSLKKEVKDSYLVIAGRFFKNEKKHISILEKGIIYLGGNLNKKEVAKLINSSDVAVVPNTENNFTKYCFPYKIVEYMACKVPIVATRVGDVAILLKNYKGLCNPNDVEDLKDKIKFQIEKKDNNYGDVKNYSWNKIAEKLNSILKS